MGSNNNSLLSWRQEAQDEDDQGQAEREFNSAKNAAYKAAYSKAARLKANGEADETIRLAVIIPPNIERKLSGDGRELSWSRVQNILEEKLHGLRRQACEDALAGQKDRKID